ncbi:cytochrome-c oxidase, cbb3-type subunit III [Novosphingobium aquiterrae]|uniref:Cbb3-type cytochrome c oxidase subunit n=1 Tax=Novosphingobium aquiterrae TaxID=624388 RepID=A0ABV6PKV5_9SPHN
MANKKIDDATGIETVGHEWDGIEELNNPLPRWWVIVFALTVVFSLGYVVVYPAIPLANAGTQGIWGWTSRGQLDAEMAAAKASRAASDAQIAALPLDQIAANKDLLGKALAGGHAAFQQNCVQCHGTGAAGSLGYPNLNDDDWLWGGNLAEIHQTLLHGIRQPGDGETRTSLMPSFGKDAILTPAQVGNVADYVLTLSGSGPVNSSSQAGAALFAANCVACHGPAGKGMRQFGAPNLTDKIWLYGGSKTQVAASVTNAHAGVMPAWGGRLDPVTVKMLALYVHSLGGGEDFAATPAAPAAAESGNAQP